MINYLFKSLYKNSIVVEERKQHGWWVSVILMIIAVTLVVVPTLYSGINARGSQIMTSATNYELDRALTLFANDQYDANISDKKLEVIDTRLLGTYDTATGESNPIVYTQEYVSTGENPTTTTKTLLRVYYYPIDPLLNDENEEAYTTWLNGQVLYRNEDGTPMVAPTTFMILTPTYFTINVYNPMNSSDDMTATTSGTYSGLYDQISKLRVLNNEEQVELINLNQLKGADDNETYTNLCRFLDNTYESSKMQALWINIGISLALSVVFIVIGMLCIFIFLKGKNSIYTNISFLDAMKIAFTFSFTPSVIAMILGFFMSAAYGMTFMLPYAMRIVWLISKSRTNPNATANQPVYQSRA